MICTLCLDEPHPGYRCPRCHAFTPGPRTVTGNKGAHGKAVNNRDIREALAGLAELARRRHGKHQTRQARTDEYEAMRARHVEHPQTRGTHRRMLSKP
jgi:hypothetical protein